ncbi:MAG: HD domain-containing phosphohydrolase, partial [bacterium]
PNGLSGDELPLQSRIMAVADIFEALTAKDRPYKEPMSLSQAVKILSFMKKDNHIDPGIFDLFVNDKLHLAYAEKEMNPDQIDMT